MGNTNRIYKNKALARYILMKLQDSKDNVLKQWKIYTLTTIKPW